MIEHSLGVRAERNSVGRRLVFKYWYRLGQRPEVEHEQLCNLFAISFRPGDRTNSFLGKRFRPVGQSVIVVVSYGFDEISGRRTMSLRGFRAEIKPDGSVHYGGEAGCEFLHDAWLRPHQRAFGPALDPFANPSLSQLMHRLDGAYHRQLGCEHRLPVIPRFPRIMLGFAPNELPPFEETTALRKIAAKSLGMPVDRLAMNGDLLVDRLLRDVWEQQFVPSGESGNDTGLTLVDAELCSIARRSLRIFEDFSELVGCPTWNPARAVKPLRFENPAAVIAADWGFDTTVDLSAQIDQASLDGIERAMRDRLGDAGPVVSQEEIYAALLAPNEPIVAWSEALPRS